MGKVDTRFQTKTAQKPYPLGWHLRIYALYKGVPPGSVSLTLGPWTYK